MSLPLRLIGTSAFVPEGNLCLGTKKFNGVVVPYAAPFIFELVILVLTAYKAVEGVNYVCVRETERPSRPLLVIL